MRRLLLSFALLSLSGQNYAADAIKGRELVANRQVGLCLLCHSAPIPEERFQGDIGPPLAGVGARYSVKELRERVANARALNPLSIMPSYGQSSGFNQANKSVEGKPLLSDTQIDDVVAYLSSLK